MGSRSTSHAQEEKAIFPAFLAAHPCFAAQVKGIGQPDDVFPDIIVKTTDAALIDFELGKWLDGPDGRGEAVPPAGGGDPPRDRPPGPEPFPPLPIFLARYGGMVSLAQMTLAGAAGYTVALLGGSSLNWEWCFRGRWQWRRRWGPGERSGFCSGSSRCERRASTS